MKNNSLKYIAVHDRQKPKIYCFRMRPILIMRCASLQGKKRESEPEFALSYLLL
jgi:hypothetical protein